MDYKELSERICALRKSKGWTQKQLADVLSVTDKTVSKWETGYTVPDVEMLDKLAKVFDCSLDELVNGSQQGASTAPVAQSASVSKVNRLSRGALIGVIITCVVVCLTALFVCLGVFVWAKRPLSVQGLGGTVSSVQVEEDTHLVRATAPSDTSAFSFSDMQLSSDKATVTVYSDASMTTAITPDVHLYAGDNVFYVRVSDGDRTVAYTVIIARNVDFSVHTHVAGTWTVLRDSNCVDTGTRQTVCADCGLTYTEVIPAKGHTEVVDAAVAATCTATGLTEGKHCSVCGTVLVAQTEVAMIDHQYVNGVCTQCGAKSEISTSIGDVPDVIVESVSAVIESNATIRAALGLIDDQDFYFNGGKGLVNEVGGCSANMYITQLSNSNVAELTSSGNVKANLIYISITISPTATDSEIKAAKQAASEYVYTAFVQINSGKFEEDVVILLPAGTELDASAHEWKPVKHFSGYFGTTDAEHPIVIDGAKLTSGTGYPDTLYFDGDGGKYFITGFFGSLYGNAVVENVTFRNLTMDEPGSNYDMSLTILQHSRNSIGIVGGVIDTPSAATNVTLRNIVVEDNCTIKGAATAAGLVGYVGASSKNGRLFNGTLTIENCHVSATVIGGPETDGYGPCGGIVGFIRRAQEEGDMDGDGIANELYTIVIKDCTFDGSVTGYQGVGAAVGDMDTGAVIFRGANDFSDATLTSVDPKGSNMVGIVGRATQNDQVVIYYTTASFAEGSGKAIGCFGDPGDSGIVGYTTDVDTRDADNKFDTVTDGLSNPIGGNNGACR